jgi:hypothetical protein
LKSKILLLLFEEILLETEAFLCCIASVRSDTTALIYHNNENLPIFFLRIFYLTSNKQYNIKQLLGWQESFVVFF